MDWTPLGIAPTKNKQAITDAYRTRLTDVNPEDKPEAFKALRAAYEEALRQAEQVQTTDDTPVGRWMEAVQTLYDDFAARIRPESWQPLLTDEVCVALDTRPLAEQALLEFLADHYYLPQTVWQTLDTVFLWTERVDELYESYPRDFIDYAVLSGIRYPENLPSALFCPGESAADCDRYRQLYFEATRREPEDSTAILDELALLPEQHPYGELLSCRLLLHRGDTEKAREVYRSLAERYPEDARISLEWAVQCMQAEDWTQAEQYALRTLSLRPDAAQARQLLADSLAAQERYEEAKEQQFLLIEAAGGDQKRIHELTAALREWNDFIIRQRQQQLEEDPDDTENRIKLAWCYLQNDRNDEALALCESIGDDYEDRYDVHNLCARVYYALNRYEDALPHLQALEEMLRTMQPDSDERTAERLATRPEKLQVLGSCLLALGRSDEAIPCFEQALSLAPDDPEVLTNMGRLLCSVGDKQRAAEVFGHLTAVLPGSYHGFFLLAQTLYDLGRDRDAFDAVNRALSLDGGDLGVYLLKMRILLRNGVWDEVRGTLDFLRQHGITDEIHVAWCEAQLLEFGEDRKQDALDCYHALARRIEQGEQTEDAARIYFRILVLEAADLDARKKEDRARMLALVEKSLSHDADDPASLDYKAWLLRRDGRPEEALAIYHRLEAMPRRTLQVEEDLASLYYEDLDRWADKALHYYELLLASDEKPVFHFYAGTCCRYLGRYDDAKDHLLRVQELEPEGIDGYNGMCYLYETMGAYEQALAQIDHVIALTGERKDDRVHNYYRHKIRLLRRLCRPHDAVRVLGEAAVRFSQEEPFREQFDVLCQFGLWDDAEAVLTAWRKSGKKRNRLSAAEIDLALFTDKIEQAREMLARRKNRLNNSDAERLTLLLGELDGEESVQMPIWEARAKTHENQTHELMNMAQVQWWCGHYDNARLYAGRALEQLDALIPNNKRFEALYRGRRCIVLAILGRLDEAEAELRAVRSLPLCETCDYCSCKDADIFEANLEEIRGSWQRAWELHRNGGERWPDDLDFAAGRRRMERKGAGQS